MQLASSVALSIAVVLVSIGGWRVLNWVWLRPKRLERCLRRQGLGGNAYRLLFGDMKESAKLTIEAKSRPMIDLSNDITPRVVPFLYKSVKNYGKDSFMWVGPIPRVNIMNPEHVKEIFTKNSDFTRPQPNPLVRLFVCGLASYEGEKWAKHRKIINLAFHQEKLKQMQPAFYQSCSELISKWEDLVSENGSCETDIWPCLTSLTSDVISRTAFGSNCLEGQKIFQLQSEQAKLFLQILQFSCIPGWRFLPSKANRRMKEIDKEIRAMLKGIINKKMEAMKTGEAAKHDLLGILLDSNSKQIEEHKNNKIIVGMSIEDVIEECKLFYFAGMETTSVLLVWTMILLSKHHNWQVKAREEVMQVFGNNKPDYDGLNRLKVVTMILNEVLRLYTPAATFARKVEKETQLGDFILPAGVEVSVPVILIHHDRQLWGDDDAQDFKPERFADGVSKATNNLLSFLPFGWGPRICVGQNFALLEAKMALSLILRHFSFELSPSYVHSPHFVITLHPQFGAPLILHKI